MDPSGCVIARLKCNTVALSLQRERFAFLMSTNSSFVGVKLLMNMRVIVYIVLTC